MTFAGTNIDHDERTTTLLHTGPYEFSRNPIYLGLTFILLGLVWMTNSFWVAAATMCVLAYLQFHVIPVEEAYVIALFPEAAAAYFRSVPRWLEVSAGPLQMEL